MKVSAILLLCLFTMWTSTSMGVNNIEAHKLHVNPQYPALVCTTFHSYSGQSHQVPDGAHSQYTELLRHTVGYFQGSGGVFGVTCFLLIKSIWDGKWTTREIKIWSWYGLVWPGMARYGPIWPDMAFYCPVWPCMDLYGLIWFCMFFMVLYAPKIVRYGPSIYP